MTTTSRVLIAFLAIPTTAVPAAAQGPPFRRYLAEGATGPFFATRLSLANPDGANPANVVLTFDSGRGTTRTLPLSLVPGGTAFVADPGRRHAGGFAEELARVGLAVRGVRPLGARDEAKGVTLLAIARA